MGGWTKRKQHQQFGICPLQVHEGDLSLELAPHHGQENNTGGPHDSERLEDRCGHLGPSRLVEQEPDRVQRHVVKVVHQHHPATCDA